MTTDITNERLAAVRQKFSQWEVDGLLITSSNNRRWLSAFTGSAGVLMVTADSATLGTDFRYWEQAHQQAPAFDLIKMGRTEELAKLPDVIEQSGARRIGIEGDELSVNQFEALKKECSEIEFKPLGETLEGLRAVKSEAEIDTIRRAAAITDQAMEQVNTLAKPGMSERELAWELEKRMREAGAEGVAFEIIVASGPNSALAHHRPGSRLLQIGDPIVIDMGAKLDGYHSDLTRSFHLGSAPDERFWAVFNLVLKAQQTALAKMRPGMTGKVIDALARDMIAAAGHANHFGHSLGHSVGLNIHETPSLSQISEVEIPAGTVTSVEPGVYVPGWGGVRIEDLVVVRSEGVEFLSRCPKRPLIPA